jgi:chromosome segregation ATPase
MPTTPTPRRGDLDAIRETVESGEVTKHRAEEQLLELCDEVEQLRADLARSRQAHGDEVNEILVETDAEADRLAAEVERLRRAKNELASRVARQGEKIRQLRNLRDALTSCLRPRLAPTPRPDAEVERRNRIGRAVAADTEVIAAYEAFAETLSERRRAIAAEVDAEQLGAEA